MINTAFPNKKRCSLNHLEEHASHWPDVNHCRIVCCSKDQFWSPVASRAYVRQIGLICEDLCRTKITNGYFSSFVKDIVRFYIPMSNMKLMNEQKSSKYLIANNLYIHGCKPLLPSLSNQSVKIAFVICHHNIQKLSTLFKSAEISKNPHQEVSFQHVNDLNLSIFVFRVLKHFLDCYYLSSFSHSSFENFSKSALTNHLYELNFAAVGIWRRSGVNCAFCMHPSFHVEISTFTFN